MTIPVISLPTDGALPPGIWPLLDFLFLHIFRADIEQGVLPDTESLAEQLDSGFVFLLILLPRLDRPFVPADDAAFGFVCHQPRSKAVLDRRTFKLRTGAEN